MVPNGRMLCSQAPFCKGTPCSTKGSLSSGETHGCKTKRDTGKASGSLFPSEKLSSLRLFKGRFWAMRGVWIKAEIHWKRQRGRLARCKSSPNALGSTEGLGLAAGTTCQHMGLLREVRALQYKAVFSAPLGCM